MLSNGSVLFFFIFFFNNLIMIHSEEKLNTNISTEKESGQEASKDMYGQFAALYERIELMIKEREEKEQKRMDRLLKTVSEQLNKNVTVLFENIIQREVRGHLSQKIEKVLSVRIDQKMNEIMQGCAGAIMSSIEGKTLNNSINKSLKTAVVESIVPIIENGMNEIRLQVVDRIGSIPINVERIEDDLSESKDDTLEYIVDTLKECNPIEEDPAEMIMHLLETDIEECFLYVLGSNDQESFRFLLDKLPPDAEIDLNKDLLVLFIQQIVSYVGSKWKDSSLRNKYTLLLGNALSHIQKDQLSHEDIEKIKNSVSTLFKVWPSFGDTQDEKWVLNIIQSMGIY